MGPVYLQIERCFKFLSFACLIPSLSFYSLFLLLLLLNSQWLDYWHATHYESWQWVVYIALNSGHHSSSLSSLNSRDAAGRQMMMAENCICSHLPMRSCWLSYHGVTLRVWYISHFRGGGINVSLASMLTVKRAINTCYSPSAFTISISWGQDQVEPSFPWHWFIRRFSDCVSVVNEQRVLMVKWWWPLTFRQWLIQKEENWGAADGKGAVTLTFWGSSSVIFRKKKKRFWED